MVIHDGEQLRRMAVLRDVVALHEAVNNNGHTAAGAVDAADLKLHNVRVRGHMMRAHSTQVPDAQPPA